MPQSLAHIHLHLIFSTKDRDRLLYEDVRPSLHAYMATVLKNLGCPVVVINSVEDHVHILFELARTLAVSKAVEEVKKSSSKWLKTQSPRLADFAWQGGYGVFAVSESNVPAVQRYIWNQAEHHRRISFQDEFLAILAKHRVAFDERFIWE